MLHAMLCYTILYHVMLYYVMSCYVMMICCVMSYHVRLCCTMLDHAMSCWTMLPAIVIWYDDDNLRCVNLHSPCHVSYVMYERLERNYICITHRFTLI